MTSKESDYSLLIEDPGIFLTSCWEFTVKVVTKSLSPWPLSLSLAMWREHSSLITSNRFSRDLYVVLEQIMLRKGDTEAERMETRYFRVDWIDYFRPDPVWINISELWSEGAETIPEELHNKSEISKATLSLGGEIQWELPRPPAGSDLGLAHGWERRLKWLHAMETRPPSPCRL